MNTEVAKSQVLLEVCGLTLERGGKRVLSDISFSLRTGEFLGIIGPNGGGKTTLLRVLLGLQTPSAGRLQWIGRREASAEIGYVPQRESVDWDFPVNVLDVVLMGRYVRAQSSFESADDLAAAEAAMGQTDVWALRDRPLPELSGGERRRVLLAQALAQDTELLLLDEPTAGLDPAHALSLGRVMQQICQGGSQARGKALLFSTHDLNLAARLAPRSVLLFGGRLALSGPTLEVLEQAGPLLGVGVHVGHLPSGAPFAVAT